MRFSPKADDEFPLWIDGLETRFAAVPLPDPRFRASRYAHAMSGENSTVWRIKELTTDGEYALKVWNGRVQHRPPLNSLCGFLNPLSSITGLECAERFCLTPDLSEPTLLKFPELAYAMLMPWVQGTSWFDAHQGNDRTAALNSWQCLQLALGLSSTLAALESRNIAHCALSPDNLLIDASSYAMRIELVGLEHIYAPDALATGVLQNVNRGYGHPSLSGAQDIAADRFPGALLIAELLGWFDPAVRSGLPSSESYFDPEELQSKHSEGFEKLVKAIDNQHPKLGQLFRRAWTSVRPQDCPQLSEWKEILSFVSRSKVAYCWQVTESRQNMKIRRQRCWQFPAGDKQSTQSVDSATAF